jgi:hypothetical protein
MPSARRVVDNGAIVAVAKPPRQRVHLAGVREEGEMRTIGLIAVVGLALLAATGCGSSQSAADSAKSKACNAVTDIKTQITTLKGLTLSTSSVDTAKTALQQIQADLQTISTQAPTVKGGLKSQLETANATFKSDVQRIAQSVTSAQSLSSAATAISTAGKTLATSYQQAFGNVKC